MIVRKKPFLLGSQAAAAMAFQIRLVQLSQPCISEEALYCVDNGSTDVTELDMIQFVRQLSYLVTALTYVQHINAARV